MCALGGRAQQHRPGLPTLIVVTVVVVVRPVRIVRRRRRGIFPPWPPSQLLLFLPLPWLLLSSSSLLLLLWMPFPLEAEAPIAVVVPRATAAYPAPPNQNGGHCWLLAHASMATVHIFVVTLMPPPLLSLLPSFSSFSSFLQSLSPPPPVTTAAVGVHVDLHNHPPQQPLARDRQCHCPPPCV